MVNQSTPLARLPALTSLFQVSVYIVWKKPMPLRALTNKVSATNTTARGSSPKATLIKPVQLTVGLNLSRRSTSSRKLLMFLPRTPSSASALSTRSAVILPISSTSPRRSLTVVVTSPELATCFCFFSCSENESETDVETAAFVALSTLASCCSLSPPPLLLFALVLLSSSSLLLRATSRSTSALLFNSL